MNTIYLSRRNLLTLLSKLDRKEIGEDTSCTIIKFRGVGEHFKQTTDAVAVIAVPDKEYYEAMKRTPGPVHEKDEPNWIEP